LSKQPVSRFLPTARKAAAMDSELAALARASRPTETQRLEARAKARSNAPIAAQYEECSQILRQLHAAFLAKEFKDGEMDLRILTEQCLTRLISWGENSRASSRLLDHALRRSSRPRNDTLRLLKDLHEILQSGMQPVSYPVASDA
jgi:hypothetical protein